MILRLQLPNSAIRQHTCRSLAEVESYLEAAWLRACLLDRGQWHELLDTRWVKVDGRPF